MLRPDDNPDLWRMACIRAFQQPFGEKDVPRSLKAECVNFDHGVVEFKNNANDFHFDIPTELFALIPHIGAQVYIDPVHYIVRLMPGFGAPVVDLISGRPR